MTGVCCGAVISPSRPRTAHVTATARRVARVKVDPRAPVVIGTRLLAFDEGVCCVVQSSALDVRVCMFSPAF